MFSSCIVTVDGVVVGDGGVGVFVGVGGVISDRFSEGKCVLDSVIEDSDVSDEELDESSLREPTWNRGVNRVMVSALGREAKRPCIRGCPFQASVEVFEGKRHDAATMHE